MTNPEDRVIDEIDRLVDEQLAGGPHDDYGMNYYPDCNLCPHDWHGEQCVHCSCERSTGEVVTKQAPPFIAGSGVIPADEFINDEDYDGRPGYTMSDLEAMRWHREGAHRHRIIHAAQPGAPWYAPPIRERMIRFRAADSEVESVVEGVVSVQEVVLTENHCTVTLLVSPVRGELTFPHPPHIPEGMIAVEGGTAEGFAPLGYLHPNDLDVETRTDYDASSGYVYTHEVTIRINAQVSDALLQRLGGYA